MPRLERRYRDCQASRHSFGAEDRFDTGCTSPRRARCFSHGWVQHLPAKDTHAESARDAAINLPHGIRQSRMRFDDFANALVIRTASVGKRAAMFVPSKQRYAQL